VTFLQLLNDSFQRLDKIPNALGASNLAADRMKRFMNDRYRELMRLDGIADTLRDETFTVTSSAGYNRLSLPSAAATISNVVDTANQIKLREVALSWIRERDPGNTNSGTPYVYAVLNPNGVSVQPSASGATLEILSSDPADVRGFTVEGMLNGWQFTAYTGFLTGTVPVALPSFELIFRLEVSSALLGVANSSVTIRETAPLVKNLLSLQKGASASAAQMDQNALFSWVLYLWPTPSGVYPYQIDFSRALYELVNDSDVPALPQDFHNLLVWGCCEDECIHMDDSRAQNFRARWEKDVRELRAYLVRARGTRFVPGRRSGSRYSDLGPYFPAGDF
jgi:hypothetical protein